jgi:hypothetical protein
VFYVFSLLQFIIKYHTEDFMMFCYVDGGDSWSWVRGFSKAKSAKVYENDLGLGG